MLPGLVLDTTGPNHLSVRETVEMADRRTAGAAVTFREKEFVLGMLRQSTTWGRENRVLTEIVRRGAICEHRPGWRWPLSVLSVEASTSGRALA